MFREYLSKLYACWYSLILKSSAFRQSGRTSWSGWSYASSWYGVVEPQLSEGLYALLWYNVVGVLL
jgi:hypothetical protein